MTVSTQFRMRIDKRLGDLLGGARRSIRVWLDRPGSIFLKPGTECGESWSNQFGRFPTIRRSLIVSMFLLLPCVIGGAPRSLAATDPVSFVSDLGSRALAAMRSGATAA